MLSFRITPITTYTMMRADSPVEQQLQKPSLISPASSMSMTVPLADREQDSRALQQQQQQHDMAAQLLDMMGGLLDGADETLDNLEEDSKLLPHAILRRCAEFADLIGGLASELEHQSPQEQQQLASTIHEDIHSLRLQVQTTTAGSAGNLVSSSSDYALDSLSKTPSPSIFNKMSLKTVSPTSLSATALPPPPLELPPANDYEQYETAEAEEPALIFPDDGLNENDILKAIAGASTLLRDIESAFRDISKDDAEEIADVALTVARLFLMSLQNIHDTLTPESLVQQASSGRGFPVDRSSPRSTVVIEELADSINIEEDEENQQHLTDLEAGTLSTTPSVRRNSRHRTPQRVRVLWPPIGPNVDAALGWTKEEATKRPLLAAALGLTLWPVAISTAIIGGTACMADGILQDAYKHFQEGPLITNLEQGAASMYQAGKLTFITGKLAGKQTLRVVQKQVDRQGGIGPILENVGHMALERVTHPIETAGMIFDGVNWGIARIKDTVDHIASMHEEGITAQDLQ